MFKNPFLFRFKMAEINQGVASFEADILKCHRQSFQKDEFDYDRRFAGLEQKIASGNTIVATVNRDK